MKMKKALLALVCAVSLVVATFVGTMAYFTDTESVTNTFTVGKVGITLDEADVKPDGTIDTNKRVIENIYHLIPGMTYIKDPTIRVDADSEECYLFVKIENGLVRNNETHEENIETTDATKTIAKQMSDLGWVEIDATNHIYALAKTADSTKENDFKYTVFGGAEVVVFNEFTIDGNKVVNVPDGEAVPEGKIDLTPYISSDNAPAIKVTAYAVQAAGFDNAKAAWTATFGNSNN